MLSSKHNYLRYRRKIINNLSADAQAGSKTLRTKHDPVQMGWQVGDRIAIAKTTGNDRGQHVEITGISSFKIDIKDRVTDTVRFQPMEITSLPFDRSLEGFTAKCSLGRKSKH